MAASYVLVVSLFMVGCFENGFSSPVKRAAGDQLEGETIEGQLNNDDVVEGDIIVSTDRNAVSNLWPPIAGHISVPYVINSAIADRTDDIEAAFDMITSRTCVSFYRRGNERGYVEFIKANGCAAQVGYTTLRQVVHVGPPCNVGNIAHEILHALGFHHEHTRMDRQQHISIVYDNIIRGMEGNYAEKNGNTLGLPYDIQSIMHYGGTYFSKNGQPTIVPKSSERGASQMGQRSFLTNLDVDKVRRLYQCDTIEEEEADFAYVATTIPGTTASAKATTDRQGLPSAGNSTTAVLGTAASANATHV